MRAVRIHQYGGPEVLTLEDVPRPDVVDGEVLIAVHAIGINPIDWKLREGFARERIPLEMPVILGTDISGVVEAVGKGVTRFKVGDPVFSMVGLSGAYAQYVCVTEALVANKPKNLNHLEAASVPLAALTAWQALFVHDNLTAGQTVLIHAAAGGVGGFAVQLAKAKGARVVATASPPNHDYLRQLGADHLIDYHAGPFEQQLETLNIDVDLVVDLVGGETTERSLGLLKTGGRLVQLVPSAAPIVDLAAQAGLQATYMTAQPNGDMLEQISQRFNASELVSNIAASFPFAEIAAAHEMSASGRTRGKIVLHFSDDALPRG